MLIVTDHADGHDCRAGDDGKENVCDIEGR